MDLIKKAKKSALALKSEVQGIIGAPGQQPGSYGYNPSQSSYNQSSPTYPQYGQTNPQVQGFQSQYGAPAQSYPQSGQPQTQYASGAYHNVSTNQYNAHQPGGQQSPGLGGQQQFQQAQYGHPQPQNQQQQYQSHTAPLIGTQQHMSSQSQSQYQPTIVHNLIAPPWNPNAPGVQQNNPPPQTYQQTPMNSPPPGHFQGHQPPTTQNFTQMHPSPPVQQQYVSPPIPQPYSAPVVPQSYSTPQVPQNHSSPSSYFPPGQQGQPPNQTPQQQASNFMQNFVAQTQNQPAQNQSIQNPTQYGLQSPPLPMGKPQPPAQNPSHQGFYPQGVIQPSQTPPLPPRQDTYPAPQQFHSNQAAPNYGQMPSQNTAFQPQHQSQQQAPQQPPQQSQQQPQIYSESQHLTGQFHQSSESFSQPPPAYHTIEGQHTPLPGKFQPQQQFNQQNTTQTTTLSSPPIQNIAPPPIQNATPPPQSRPSQQHDIVPQPSRFSPQPVEQRPPPQHNQSSLSQAQPQSPPSQQQNVVSQPSRFSPRPADQRPPPPQQNNQSFSSQPQPQSQPLQQQNVTTQPLRFSPGPMQSQMPQPPTQSTQQHNVASQPPRFSPQAVQGQMRPPQKESQSFPQQQQTQPLKTPTYQTQSSVPSSPSYQSAGGQKFPLNPQRINSPSASSEHRQSPVQALPFSAPKPTQSQGQGGSMFFNTHGTPPPQKVQSQPPSHTSQSSPITPAPVASQARPNQGQGGSTFFDTHGAPPSPKLQSQPPSHTSQSSPIPPAPIASQTRPNQASKPVRQTTSPPYPIESHESFNQVPTHSVSSRPNPSITPAPLQPQTQPSHNQMPPRQNTSRPVVEDFQKYNQMTAESPSLKPAPLNFQSGAKRTGTSPTSNISLPPAKQHQTYDQSTSQGRVSPLSQAPSEGQYKAFRPAEAPAPKPAPLFSSRQAPPRQETIPPPTKEYKAFSQKSQTPASNYTAFKPPGSRADHGQVSPPKSSTPAPQISPLHSPAPTPAQARPQQSQQLPYQVSPQLQQSRPVYGHQNSFQMPAPPPASQSPHAGMVSPLSPSHTHSYPQVFEMDSGDPILSVPQGRPSFPSSHSGPIEFADGLISVEHEASTPVPSIQSKPSNRPETGRDLDLQRAPKTQCVGFEATLTDVNQFFEVHPAIVSQHGIHNTSGRDLVICEYCYHTFIAPHPAIAKQFRPRAKGTRADKSLPISFEKMRGCGLAFPRIRQTILGQAIPQRNIQPLVEYMKLDSTLSSCSGEPQTGSYFGTKAIKALVLCKSCFESYIKSTAFERNFALIQTTPGLRWGCDWSDSGYLSRALLTDLAKNPPDFAHFALQANKRLAIPPCNGHKQDIAASGPRGSTIFRSVEDNQGVFCSAHFYDLVVGTPAQQAFGYEIKLDDDQRHGLSCDLTFPFSINNMAKAVRLRKYQIWYLPIVASNTTHACPSIAGHDEGDLEALNSPPWYHLRSHPQVEICARCYGTEAVVSQATTLFTPITRSLTPGRIRQCHFSPTTTQSFSADPMTHENTTAWRGHYLRNILTYCSDSGGDFTLFSQAATKISALPPACGSNLRTFTKPSGRKWFGHQASHPQNPNDATVIICAECHAFAVKGTQLEEFMGNDLTALAYNLSPSGVQCATWSSQTKLRLRAACERNEFGTYAQFQRQREDLYARLSQAVKELEVLSGLLMQRTGRQDGGVSAVMGGLSLGSELQREQGNMPGLNMVMWEMASPQRLEGEVKRRVEVLEVLRAEWVVVK